MMASDNQMTPEQVTLVQESFAKVAPIADQAAIMFYDRLFELAPQVKTMFPADMTEQRRKLMATLAFAVNGLANLQSVLPAASALAKRHKHMASSPSITPSLALRCCGLWRRGWAMPGRLKLPRPGLRPMARSPP
jgi:hemoglobin-like flavoprotein